MKQIFVLLSMLVFLIILSTSAFAEGGKIRSDLGSGSTIENVNEDMVPDEYRRG